MPEERALAQVLAAAHRSCPAHRNRTTSSSSRAQDFCDDGKDLNSAAEEEVQESLHPSPARASAPSGDDPRGLLPQPMPAPVASTQLEPMSPASTVVSMEMDCDSEFTETSVPAVYSWELSSV